MHTYFLGLSLVGYDALWGRMIRAGVANAVGSVKRSGTFPNGDNLLTCFTGIATFDRFLIPAVIFYNNILSNESPTDRMLLVSLFTTMQTMSHCMLVLGWSRGRRPWWAIWEHLFWGVFNQAWGAAAVYPLYCFTHVERFLEEVKPKNNQEMGPSDPSDALALIPAAALGAITPVMLLYPAFNSACTASQRQSLIAFYRFTPLLSAIAQPLFSWLATKVSRATAWKPRPTNSKAFVAASLVLSGAVAAAGHGWAVLSAGNGELGQVFCPSGYIDITSPTVIADGARDFLQWDIFVIIAALIPFSDLVFRSSNSFRRVRKRSKYLSMALDSFIGRMACLTLASCTLSPAAVLAFSLAAKAYSS